MDLAMAAVLRRMEELEQRNELQRRADAGKIRELEARLWRVTNPDPEQAITQGQYNDSPFADKIVEAPYPENLNLSELIKYDGTQDPQVHLDAFDTTMYIKGIEEPLITRLFATTLIGAAQTWFSSLPTGSIRSFEEFGGRFLLNFATSKKQPKSEFALGKIKQQLVPRLSKNAHLHLVIVGLHGTSRLAKSKYKEPPRTLVEFNARSKKYLELEQMELENVDQKCQPGQGEKLGGRRANDLRGKRQDDKFQLRGRFDKYAPLNSSRSQIWREVASTDMKKVERPRPLQNPAGLDQSRYCAFHDGPGHTTNECWDLKDAIEKYVREGKLRQYLIRTQGWRNRKRRGGQFMSPPKDKKFREEDRGKKPAREDDEFQEPEFECNVIDGAFGGGRDTMNARRKYLREVLSIRERPKFKEEEAEPPLLYFTKKELEDVVPGHVDGLVITGTLVNCRVKKIFLDNGSCADIILWHAFQKMNLDEEDLKPCDTALIAFNGCNTHPKGYIDLRLTLGTKEAYKSERVRFIVADFPSEYNVILGRPVIHDWDMLISTKHQELKMVGKQGTVLTIAGDQKESRDCYFRSVRMVNKDSEVIDVLKQNNHEPSERSSVHVLELDMRDDTQMPRSEPDGELEEIVMGEQGQITKIGKGSRFLLPQVSCLSRFKASGLKEEEAQLGMPAGAGRSREGIAGGRIHPGNTIHNLVV
ncbi:uncharacterized protein LOC133290634 [Gastrolobium bilobum]|uniref:uncharacterized protein LOC133290634 n=1 Tax=Gastrolobium bilobum TaxID=150636 RepID=UPI002AAFD188|nr:uncharacterized protein LOC133290634 [Gastrolobium bilobum]